MTENPPQHKNPTITAEEFERQYAAAWHVSVEQLRALGRIVEPAGECDFPECQGWHMGYRED